MTPDFQDDLKFMGRRLIAEMTRLNYAHPFTWLGRPIIQFPHDLLAMQEIIWRTQPDVIIETGVAHGGSIVFHASMLELLGGDGRVIGVDIEIRPHNRVEIDKHPLRRRIDLIEGSSVDPVVIEEVYRLARGRGSALVVLDSNHTHEHVLAELQAYTPLVRTGGYVVVCDTGIDDLPQEYFPNRPWGPGNNPKTAVRAFLQADNRFIVDNEIENKCLLTAAPEGYLRCIKD